MRPRRCKSRGWLVFASHELFSRSPSDAPNRAVNWGYIDHMTSLHPAVSAYEHAVSDYRRGRPGYPAAATDWLAAMAGLDRRSVVLDLGAGTGNLTRPLLRHTRRVVAVEPVRAFRHTLRALEGVAVVAGTAGSLPIRSSSFDLVTAGQAFHWFANRESVEQIGRVLRPDGWLALVWNVRPPEPELHRAVNDVLAPYRGRAPGYANGEWRRAFDHSEVLTLGPRRSWEWVHELDEAGFLARFRSVSVIAQLDERSVVEDALRSVFQRFARRGRLAVPYRTDVYLARHAENPE